MNDVVQRDDVGVLQLLEERGLPDGREGRTLLLLQADLLQGDDLVCQAERRYNVMWYSLPLVAYFPKKVAVLWEWSSIWLSKAACRFKTSEPFPSFLGGITVEELDRAKRHLMTYPQGTIRNRRRRPGGRPGDRAKARVVTVSRKCRVQRAAPISSATLATHLLYPLKTVA